MLLVVDPALGDPGSFESADGVTPPMRKARARHFRSRITLPASHMESAVSDVLDMLAGRCAAAAAARGGARPSGGGARPPGTQRRLAA